MMRAHPWRYRWRQFAKAGRGRLNSQEVHEVREVLDGRLLDLLLGMAGIAQRHGYDVFLALKAQGWRDRDLLAAALLHDAGKGRLGAVSRALWVLSGALVPGLRERLAEGALGRRLGFWHNRHHPALGAERLALLGASPITIWLVEHHEVRGHADPVLIALQEGDDDN